MGVFEHQPLQETYQQINKKGGREIANIALNLYFKIRQAIYSMPAYLKNPTPVYLNATTGEKQEGFNICLMKKCVFVLMYNGKAHIVFFGDTDWLTNYSHHIDISKPDAIDEIIRIFMQEMDNPRSRDEIIMKADEGDGE